MTNDARRGWLVILVICIVQLLNFGIAGLFSLLLAIGLAGSALWLIEKVALWRKV